MTTVTAKTRGFYGHLREAGEVFDIPDDEEPGEWMLLPGQEKSRGAKKVTAKPEMAPKDVPLASAPFNVPEQVYKVKHNGGGNFIVIDAAGAQVGEIFPLNKADNLEAKTKAQAEADRLNAAAASPTISPTQAAQLSQEEVDAGHGKEESDDGLPDA
jgi:hypothetical protein